MKNIHILLTEKSSKLISSGKEFTLLKNLTIDKRCKNIYITSDEEIKEGDWFFVALTDKIGKCEDIICEKNICLSHWCKKIILTTDQDLMKDGVQAIDDEFLEWFVKNPGCESVEVDKAEHGMYKDDVYYKLSNKIFYKIIIPKEEPKKNFYCGDEVDYDDKCLEQCDRCVDATGVDYGYLPKEHVELINKNIDEFDEKIKEFKHESKVLTTKEVMEGRSSAYEFIDFDKQETLEEAAERLYPGVDRQVDRMLFISGVKWQAKRMYSEEEVLEILFESSCNNDIDKKEMKEWFEQFKKK